LSETIDERQLEMTWEEFKSLVFTVVRMEGSVEYTDLVVNKLNFRFTYKDVLDGLLELWDGGKVYPDHYTNEWCVGQDNLTKRRRIK
jgi:hypothetical protein